MKGSNTERRSMKGGGGVGGFHSNLKNSDSSSNIHFFAKRNFK